MTIDKLANLLGNIKDLKRSGWLKRKVENPESVADHSFGVALLAYLLCPKELDKQKCLELAIIHDLAETITGDFTPCDNIPPEVKSQGEIKAIEEIAKELGKPKLVDLFIEYEERKTPEAKFVSQIDKLEAVCQAKYYDAKNRSNFYPCTINDYKSLYEEFSENAKGKLWKI